METAYGRPAATRFEEDMSWETLSLLALAAVAALTAFILMLAGVLARFPR